MTRQNRVQPTGEIAAIPSRGMFTGNRGCIHNAEGRITRRWTTKAWICCRLNWKGVRRQLMTPGRWTELFFLDEAVALTAGHRPCAYCRREDYNRWRDGWARAFGAVGFARDMDAVLHPARVDPGTKGQQRQMAEAESLPDGTYILTDGPNLVWRDSIFPYMSDGYAAPSMRPSGPVTVLTPAPVVAVLAAGYRPALHPSLG